MTKDAPKSDASRFAQPDPNLAVGTTHSGFTVTSIEPLPEFSGTAYIMRHDATDARLMWLAIDDANRSFAIAFKTPPADDTGVFHIIEHSVLCGSDRFPVKEPFVNLLKSSMQTFLNAMTYPDKTIYPVSSTNVTDLENLMDVYLDAVLHPAIYHRKCIFEQEGWHLETEGPDAPLAYNGVVFNEMKGALSNPDEISFMHMQRDLFPDTPYQFESGGDPRAIPQLTYEGFLDHHARHYSLPNSYTILYGDLDIERELAFVNSRFEEATQRKVGAPNPLPLQAPHVSPMRKVEMATAPENASVTLAYVVGTAQDRERTLATDVLLDALAGSNEAPLKRAVLDAELGDDFQAALVDGLLQPQVFFTLKGAKPEVGEQFKQLVQQTCANLVANGIDKERLSASLSQAEFNLRENDWGSTYSDGVMLSILALSSWLYDDSRPVDYLRYERELAHMRDGLENGYFEQLLDSVICKSEHCAAIELVPVEEGDAAEEQAELEQLRAGMSDADVKAIMDEVEALREEQERPDAPEDLAKLPRLSIDDIGEAPKETPAHRAKAPLPCLAHDLDTHGIVYAYQYFDLRRLTFEDLPYVGLLADLLGKLDTKRLSAARLDTMVEENLGSLSFFIEMYGRDEDPFHVQPMLVVGASSLVEKVEALATLPAEVWSTTLFDDTDRILDILQQRRVSMEQRYLSAGHNCAIARLATYFSRPQIALEAMTGVDYYLFIKDLLANWDERAAELPGRLSELAGRIFTTDEVLVSITCPEADRTRYWEAAGTLGLPTAGSEACKHRLVTPEPCVHNEAFVTPANVCFVAEGQPKSSLDVGNEGDWSIATRALSYDYLWNEVRVKGGAYGCGFRRPTSGLTQFWSYRDPAVDPTVARYEQSAAWIEGWDPSEEDLTGYIVSVVAGHDAPLKPRLLARRQDSLVLAGRPEGYRDKIRAQKLAVTPERVRALAPTLAQLSTNHAFCVFGGRDQIEASNLDLKVIDLMG
ncbi:MAG: insulinase family protein [Atopobiaceae bacterium]|nr:insulinase family protein [Atopobiaceae bacterium]